MKRTYLKGCDWCRATGYVTYYSPNNTTTTTSATNVCPVCKGSGTILVTEEDWVGDNITDLTYIVPPTTG